MKKRISLAVFLLLACTLTAAAKGKKVLLPADVLQAKTVWVLIDPQAGVAIDAPMANREARQNVQDALVSWGRFTIAMDASTADLIITVRKGNGKAARGTVGGSPFNDDPIMFGSQGAAGSREGNIDRQPQTGGAPDSQARTASPQIEMGDAEDTFAVYRGTHGAGDSPLKTAPVWRYIQKDALQPPGVPAVEAFKRLIAEAEKQQAAKP